MQKLTTTADANAKQPKLVAPPGACDHLFVPERMVWGSDWPPVNLDGREMPDDGDLLDLLLDWVPDEGTRNRILVDNANKLYGF